MLSKLSAEEMIGGFVMLAVALGIVVLNDRLKRRSKSSAASSTPPKTSFVFIIGGIGLLLAVVLGIRVQNREKLAMAVGAIASAVFLLIISKPILRMVLGKRLVIDGNGKCPKCGADVTFTPGQKGDTAFQCAACGESATYV